MLNAVETTRYANTVDGVPSIPDFSDAPGGDISFEDLFPGPDGNQPTTAVSGDPFISTQPVVPQAPPPQDDFFIRAGDTVYKSREDAERGISHKDTVIQELRLREIARSGVDPITNQRIDLNNIGQSSPQPAPPMNYLQNRDQYFQDLVKAVNENNSGAYFEAQTKLIGDYLAPVAPVIQQLARERVLSSVSGEIKDFDTFLQSPEYKATLADQPALGQAITMAESDYNMYQQLPGLYKLAYWASQGRRLPELLKAAQQPQTNQTPQARPLTSTATTAIPSAHTAQPGFKTSEGRKAIMEELASKGIADMKW